MKQNTRAPGRVLLDPLRSNAKGRAPVMARSALRWLAPLSSAGVLAALVVHASPDDFAAGDATGLDAEPPVPIAAVQRPDPAPRRSTAQQASGASVELAQAEPEAPQRIREVERGRAEPGRKARHPNGEAPSLIPDYEHMSALGALMGDKIGGNFGFGGLGLRGTSRAGGATGEGTIGLANIGTPAHGSGYGQRACNEGAKGQRVAQVRSGTPWVQGDLSAEVIRRIVSRHINEVRFCFEQALERRDALHARVAVRFEIAPDGAVSSASVASSTLGSTPAESCIASAVKRWMFPAPHDAAAVVVEYPFVLQQTRTRCDVERSDPSRG